MTPNLIVILGPTASGKTAMAARLARETGGEILSVDSRQVYRRMDIGTGKDLADYIVDGTAVPHHLVDLVDPREEYSLFAFLRAFEAACALVRGRDALPIAVGGSGLYLDAILREYRLAEVPENPSLRESLEGMDMDALEGRLRTLRPELHNRTDLGDRRRIYRAIEIASAGHDGSAAPGTARDRERFRPLVVGIRWERDALRLRIADRLRQRLAAGLVEEVSNLHAEGIPWERLDAFGLEYRYVGAFLRGGLSYEDMRRVLETRIRQFAKRQMTWFRGMERKGVVIQWIPGGDGAALRRLVANAMQRRGESQA